LFDEEVSSLGIDFPHPFYVTEEESLGNESRQRCLINCRRMLIHRAADLGHRIDQRLRRNDVAQTQRGTKNFAYRSRVNHPAGVIHPLQRGKWWPGKAELRVVVVFKNKRLISTRKIEQCGPTLKTHRNAERKLMGRRYVNDLRQWFSG
jgi:hypothetical protein